MQIGEPQRVIVVEPLELPVGSPERQPEPEREPTIHEPEPEKVPVASPAAMTQVRSPTWPPWQMLS
jgi:hypothetical protein